MLLPLTIPQKKQAQQYLIACLQNTGTGKTSFTISVTGRSYCSHYSTWPIQLFQTQHTSSLPTR
jgi:hypothetical protein